MACCLRHQGLIWFLAATKQLYKWYFPSFCLSVCPSVCPSVCQTFLLCSHQRVIMKFSESYYQWQSKVHAKGQGQSARVKVTEAKTQLNSFRTVTSIRIHIWWWNDAHSLMLRRRGARLFFKVIRQISRSHGWNIVDVDPNWAILDCNSSLNSPMVTEWCSRLGVA